VLKLNIKRHITDHNIYRRYMSDENDCARCSLTQRCFYRKNTKRRSLDVPLGADKTNFSKLMQDKVDSDNRLFSVCSAALTAAESGGPGVVGSRWH